MTIIRSGQTRKLLRQETLSYNGDPTAMPTEIRQVEGLPNVNSMTSANGYASAPTITNSIWERILGIPAASRCLSLFRD